MQVRLGRILPRLMLLLLWLPRLLWITSTASQFKCIKTMHHHFLHSKHYYSIHSTHRLCLPQAALSTRVIHDEAAPAAARKDILLVAVYCLGIAAVGLGDSGLGIAAVEPGTRSVTEAAYAAGLAADAALAGVVVAWDAVKPVATGVHQRTVSAEIAVVAADMSDWETTAVGAAAGDLIVAVEVAADAD